jgi:hypothetical protein
LLSTYHSGFADPPMLLLLGQGMRNDDDGIADKGESRGQRDPFEDSLLGLGDIIMDEPLDEVAGRIGGRERLSSRTESSRFGDISIRFRGGNAAEGEGSQKEDEHNDGIGILQHSDGGAHRAGVGPSLAVVVVDEERPSHDEASLSLHWRVRPGCEDSRVAETGGGGR